MITLVLTLVESVGHVWENKLSAHELQFVASVKPIIDESRALEKGSGRGICVCPHFQVLDDVWFYISLALHISIGPAQCFQSNP